MKKAVKYKSPIITYYVYGKGVPLLLLHGFGEKNSIWNKQVKYLSNYCTLIIPDLPGSGESELPDGPAKNISIEYLAECIHSIVKNENIEQCIMLGHSMGGYITLAFAEKYPEKLKAFGFVQSTAFADSEEKKQTRLKGIKTLETFGSHTFLKTAIPTLFSEKSKKNKKAVIEGLIKEGRNFKNKSLQQYYYAMMQRPDRTNVLKNNKLPVLFVIGTEDVAAPLNDVLKQVYLPEIAYIHIIKNTGHMSMIEAPDKLNVALKNFVNALE